MTSTRPFRFGLQAFTVSSGKEWLDIARRAEDLGYCTLFTTDHYFGPGEISDSTGHRPVDVAPIAAMMAAAGVTTDLRVGCRVFAVDYHNPNVLAKELATIDFLTEGRLEVGLGAGWVAAEYDGLGIPMDRPGVRIERLAETVELVRAHWTGEPLDIDGKYVHASGFAGRPVPVQTPPPIMIGGGAPRVLRTAGRLADIVSLNFNNASGTLGSASVVSATLEKTQEKLGWIREGAGDRFDDLELEVAAYFAAVTDEPAEATAAMAGRFGVTPEELAVHPHALIGTVDGICEALQQRRDELGFSYVTIAQRNMEEFGPVVARLTGELIPPPMDEHELERLVDRQAIVDVVVQYATGVDRRDWELYARCFTDPCEFDFSGWRGQPAVKMSPHEWAAKVRATNGNFDTTQHLSTNHVVTFETDDRARCVSNMHAQHWFSAARLVELGQPGQPEETPEPTPDPPGGPRWCTLGGFYTNTVVRTADGWRICRCQLDVTWTTGDPSIFDLARSLGDPAGRS